MLEKLKMFSVKSSVPEQMCTDWELTVTHHFVALKNHIQRWQYLPLDGSSFMHCWWPNPEVTGSLH